MSGNFDICNAFFVFYNILHDDEQD